MLFHNFLYVVAVYVFMIGVITESQKCLDDSVKEVTFMIVVYRTLIKIRRSFIHRTRLYRQ